MKGNWSRTLACALLGVIALMLSLRLWRGPQDPLPVHAATTPPPPPASAWTLGPKRILVMRVVFPDAPESPGSDEATLDLLRDVNEFYVANSYGAFSLDPVFTPILMLPRTVAEYASDPGQRHALRVDALEAARQAGFAAETFDLDLVINLELFGFKGEIAGRGCWIQGLDTDATIHELGHNLGLGHANLWIGRGDTVIGPGRMQGYGNRFDAMSHPLPGAWRDRHFNVAHKSLLGWLPASNVRQAAASDTYRLRAFDVGTLEEGEAYALMVPRPDGRHYWIERRSRCTNNAFAENGVLIYFGAWSESYGASPLLDMTPHSRWGEDSSDAPLVLGRTFSDHASGIHITPLTRSQADPRMVEIQIVHGFFPSNRPPHITLAGPPAGVEPGAQIQLRATPQDPDGDPVSVSWEFGDGTLGGDRDVVQKSWSQEGDYVVRCWVSDRRGGTSCATMTVRVGQPGTFRVSGRITSGGTPLCGARVSLGPDQVTYTDADGRYTATGLTHGTYQIHPGRAWHAFTPLSRIVLIDGADVEGQDFEGAWTDAPNNPPYVVTQHPVSSTFYGAPAAVPLEAWAYDDGLVRWVQFASPEGGGALRMSNSLLTLWTNTWTDVPEGLHMILLEAVDDDGAVGSGLPAYVTVMNALVRLDSPRRDAAGAVTLTTLGPEGATLALEASSDFTTWQTIEIRTNAPSQSQWHDASAVDAPRRFYRVRVEAEL